MLWDLSWDLIGANWVLVGLLAEAKVESREDKRERDAEPHAEEGQHGGEGYSTRGVLAPDEEVQEEPHAKHNTGIEHGRLGEGGRDITSRY